MSYYQITGGNKLEGSVVVQGAKNAVLPILAAAALCEDCKITNCPHLTDVQVALDILKQMGCSSVWKDHVIKTVQTSGGSGVIPSHLVCAMRSSIVFLGAAVARFGYAEMTSPGGCPLGSRPIDLHLMALSKMGVNIEESNNIMMCSAPSGLVGADITLPFPSVGATENILIAAVTARGVTNLVGGAKEPEIEDLIEFLRKCGADIQCLVDGTVKITGVSKLKGCTHKIIPDRIVAGTYLGATVLTRGTVELTEVNPSHLLSTLAFLSNAGCRLEISPNKIFCCGCRRLDGFGRLVTAPYPAFPTDMQGILMAVATKSSGESTFIENIFDSRYKHITELRKLGADILCQGKVAVVNGVEKLHGGHLACTDLRGGAAMVIGALGAEGTSVITKLRHIDRGYENVAENLAGIGANIKRVD